MSIKQRILIELDCLIDSPMAVLAQHWPDKFAKEDITSYRSRLDDFFWKRWGMSKGEWEATYASRDETTLYEAIPTELMVNIKEVIGGAVMRGVTTPVYEKVSVHINTAPYGLSMEAKREIKTVLTEMLLDNVDVEVVDIGIKALTPQFLKENYEVIFMRDFIRWLELHPNVGEQAMARTVFNYPAVMHTDDPEIIEKAVREKSNPFTTAKAVMAPFITMEALDVQLFCMLDPKSLDL